jgi:hypothetical protein
MVVLLSGERAFSQKHASRGSLERLPCPVGMGDLLERVRVDRQGDRRTRMTSIWRRSRKSSNSLKRWSSVGHGDVDDVAALPARRAGHRTSRCSATPTGRRRSCAHRRVRTGRLASGALARVAATRSWSPAGVTASTPPPTSGAAGWWRRRRTRPRAVCRPHRVHRQPLYCPLLGLFGNEDANHAGTGRCARAGAEAAGQDVRLSPLRRGGPRLLILRPTGRLPRRAGARRLAESLGLLRTQLGGS